ncbi:MAG: succinylglutamate desuccinylase/aspartoacylase family protein, partial [Acidimicrobiia bacterium]|nr:succinylglutamate desuccinylase/aspartoacylase family protein [Acidimicrobiia bacterium]
AIHGDELNGIEIIRRLLAAVDPALLRGVLIAVPIVNVFGFVNESRYLPDRRDLNRSFPGSTRGSLAARLADLFMSEIVALCGVGVDFHTGSDGRFNTPQVRADMNDPDTRRLAEAFGAPLLVQAKLRDGSLREAAAAKGVRILLFEGGEAGRIDEDVVATGVEGTLRLMAALDMIDGEFVPPIEPVRVRKTRWVRARRSGTALMRTRPGVRVQQGEVVAEIHDPMRARPTVVKSPESGIVVGCSVSGLVNQGDALVNLGLVEA